MKAPPGYENLLKGHASRGSVWLGDDHVLVIEHTNILLPVREGYRRFDYDSIQGVFLAPTKRRLFIGVLLAIPFGLFTILALALSASEPGLAAFLGGVALLPGILLVINAIKGQGGGVVILTAVRPWKVKAVSRLSQARRVYDVLTFRCAEAQGGTLTEAASGASPDTSASATAPSASPPPVPPASAAVPAMSPGMDLRSPHRATLPGYLAALACGLFFTGEIGVDHPAFTVADLLAGVAAFTLLVISLAAGRSLRLVGGGFAWFATMGCLGVVGLTAYALAVYGVMHSRVDAAGPESPPFTTQRINHAYQLVQSLAVFPRDAAPVVIGVVAAAGLALAAAGGWGALCAHALRRQYLAAGGSPDTPKPPPMRPADAPPQATGSKSTRHEPW